MEAEKIHIEMVSSHSIKGFPMIIKKISRSLIVHVWMLIYVYINTMNIQIGVGFGGLEEMSHSGAEILYLVISSG